MFSALPVPRIAKAATGPPSFALSIDSALTALSQKYTVFAAISRRTSLVQPYPCFSPWVIVFTPPLIAGSR